MKTNAIVIWLVLLCFACGRVLAEPGTDEEKIRAIVQQLLHEKDSRIEKLEARIQQLEQQIAQSQPVSTPKTTPDTVPVAPNSVNSQVVSDESVLTRLEKEVDTIKESMEDNGLQMSGFFDFSARTENSSESTFDLGSLELDLEYAYNPHYAASAALVWDGDSAQIGAAVIDYHVYDESIPPRGRIFSAQGFHLQAGRFDIPFAIDYQYFATRDRVTVSAPLTTDRIQRGGFNGDGVRLYGSWDIINYAAFWTNSVYEDEGMSIGGRVGLAMGQNRYQLHRRDEPGLFEVGLSHITDLDGHNNARYSVYGADLSVNYTIWQLNTEFIWLDSHESIDDPVRNRLQETDEFAYHVTLIADLQDWTTYPIRPYIRYGRWNPSYRSMQTDDEIYSVESIDRLTLGLNFLLNDYLQLKFEYSDTLGTETTEPDFETHLGTAQLVVAF